MESPSAKKIMLRMLLILKVNLTRGDIDIVHRLNTKKKTKTRPMIVRFSNYNAKSQLFKARTNLLNATLHELRAEIFIKENLTAWRVTGYLATRETRHQGTISPPTYSPPSEVFSPPTTNKEIN